jgi:hypothetical protein
MDVLRQPFNKAQLELLKVFSKISSEKELLEIKKLIAQYYAKKATEEANRIWEERGLSEEDMQKWLHEKS